MCYSVLVETDLKKLSKEFDAEIDFESFLELYERREQGDTSFKIPRAIDHAFLIEDLSLIHI